MVDKVAMQTKVQKVNKTREVNQIKKKERFELIIF